MISFDQVSLLIRKLQHLKSYTITSYNINQLFTEKLVNPVDPGQVCLQFFCSHLIKYSSSHVDLCVFEVCQFVNAG